MDINIQGSNRFTVSQRMRDYILKRMEKLNYFKNHINSINFHLEAERHIYIISSTLSINKFGVYKFEAEAEEMYTAIDKIIHKMDVKINREKSKIQDHSNIAHEKTIDFFYEHDNDKPEPTKFVDLSIKPTTLLDAYLKMKLEEKDFYGFNLIEENENIAPAFLRKLEDDVIYLFKKDGTESYIEYSLKTSKKNVEKDRKIRNIELKKMNLLNAQKKILDQDFHFNLYIDDNEKINFLFKEGNGKWKLIS